MAKSSLAPIVVLFFLSPIVGELLSGSSPPAQFFQPVVLFLLAGLYGSGAILAREAVRRWGGGWPSVLLLGAAYGILEEGVAVKSFFDPNWPDLGVLGRYGRWVGVNWVWAEWLTIYHSIYSITIPILLVELLFPSFRSTAYLGRKGVAFFLTLISIVVILCHFYLNPYPVTLWQMLGCFLAMTILTLCAKRLRGFKPGGGESRVRNRWLWLLGASGGFTYFFLVFGFLPTAGVPVLLTISIGIALTGFIAVIVLRLSKRGMGDLNALGLASGFLTLLILLDLILEVSNPTPEDFRGQTIVGVVFTLFLILLGRRTSRREARRRRNSQAEQFPLPSLQVSCDLCRGRILKFSTHYPH
ncbi:MAG: hypothetical protein FGF50_00890 [Candidatus Brockarchaeota archaeon]|nr:hypothetical protein [Candidatus Brockarchaeota archaeon]